MLLAEQSTLSITAALRPDFAKPTQAMSRTSANPCVVMSIGHFL
jgi:hypothetical protein